MKLNRNGSLLLYQRSLAFQLGPDRSRVIIAPACAERSGHAGSLSGGKSCGHDPDGGSRDQVSGYDPAAAPQVFHAFWPQTGERDVEIFGAPLLPEDHVLAAQMKLRAPAASGDPGVRIFA